MEGTREREEWTLATCVFFTRLRWFFLVFFCFNSRYAKLHLTIQGISKRNLKEEVRVEARFVDHLRPFSPRSPSARQIELFRFLLLFLCFSCFAVSPSNH